jgi:phosphonate transport system substrate-binding protein
VQALVSRKADVAYVSAIPFLLAQRDGGATLLLAEQRADLTGTMRTTYDSVLVARQESTLSSLADVVSQASRLSVCFTSTTSASGYVMPYSALVEAGLLQPRQDVRTAFARATFGGSYTAALTEVLEGRADLAAVSAYTVEGSTADAYLPAGERAKLKVVARFPNVPTHLICVRGGLDETTRVQLREALLALAKERPELIRAVYGAEAFVEVDATEHVKPMREALQRLGVNVEQLVR